METPHTICVISEIFKFLTTKDMAKYSITNKSNNSIVIKYAMKKIGNPLTVLNKVTHHYYEDIDTMHRKIAVYKCTYCKWICTFDGYEWDKVYTTCNLCYESVCSECQVECLHWDCKICNKRACENCVIFVANDTDDAYCAKCFYTQKK
jgi:hypothetical protein